MINNNNPIQVKCPYCEYQIRMTPFFEGNARNEGDISRDNVNNPIVGQESMNAPLSFEPRKQNNMPRDYGHGMDFNNDPMNIRFLYSIVDMAHLGAIVSYVKQDTNDIRKQVEYIANEVDILKQKNKERRKRKRKNSKKKQEKGLKRQRVEVPEDYYSRWITMFNNKVENSSYPLNLPTVCIIFEDIITEEIFQKIFNMDLPFGETDTHTMKYNDKELLSLFKQKLKLQFTDILKQDNNGKLLSIDLNIKNLDVVLCKQESVFLKISFRFYCDVARVSSVHGSIESNMQPGGQSVMMDMMAPESIPTHITGNYMEQIGSSHPISQTRQREVVLPQSLSFTND
eukprot:TRINITY_DN10396_c0_g1_i1.p1 TRINITY_DN10396_c0_g1~~TRINITY_DN10396_c0_g1_i1.p1  ORF type:complete len:363 (+),score=79.43 TRINITY_DN10396_c0_g1_i1:65-1090(+)